MPLSAICRGHTSRGVHLELRVVIPHHHIRWRAGMSCTAIELKQPVVKIILRACQCSSRWRAVQSNNGQPGHVTRGMKPKLQECVWLACLVIFIQISHHLQIRFRHRGVNIGKVKHWQGLWLGMLGRRHALIRDAKVLSQQTPCLSHASAGVWIVFSRQCMHELVCTLFEIDSIKRIPSVSLVIDLGQLRNVHQYGGQRHMFTYTCRGRKHISVSRHRDHRKRGSTLEFEADFFQYSAVVHRVEFTFIVLVRQQTGTIRFTVTSAIAHLLVGNGQGFYLRGQNLPQYVSLLTRNKIWRCKVCAHASRDESILKASKMPIC